MYERLARSTKWGVTHKKLLLQKDGRIVTRKELKKQRRHGMSNLGAWSCANQLVRYTLPRCPETWNITSRKLVKGSTLYKRSRKLYDCNSDCAIMNAYFAFISLKSTSVQIVDGKLELVRKPRSEKKVTWEWSISYMLDPTNERF